MRQPKSINIAFGYSTAFAVFCLAVLLVPQQAFAQRMAYDAVLTSKSVPVGETTILQVRYQNCEPSKLPEIPEVDGLTVTYSGPSRSSNYTFEGGRQTTLVTLVHQFTVKPERQGTYVIPPIESTIKGKTYQTKSLRLSVGKERDYSQHAFIRVQVPKQTVYVGEMFQMAIHLFEVNAKVEEKPVIPSDGFVISEIGQPTQTQKRVGNQIYNQITFRYLARAVKTGELAIGPITWNVPLFFRNNSRGGRRSPFDSFFRDLVDLNSTIRRDVTLKSDPVNLNVQPLPEEGQPEGFTGAVGNFTMKFAASPTQVTAGDPITLTMNLTGRGALEALKMPPLDSWREFKQYPETSTISYSDEIGLSGTKAFEKVVIPNNAEITKIPEVQFSFFDPLEEKYKTLTQAPIPLTVSPNLSAVSQPTVIANSGGAETPLVLATNIVHIKPHFGTVATSTAPWITQKWFLGFQLIPLFAWVGAFVYRMQKNASGRNPRALRKKKVRAMVSEGLNELQQLAAQQRSEDFFALLFRMLQEQIGERLDLPANAITEAIVDEKLRDRLSSPEQLQELERIFHTCNQSRYAPVDSPKELSQIASEVEQILAELQQLPDPGKG